MKKNTNQKNNFKSLKTRIIAAVLAAVTLISIFSGAAVTASAASVGDMAKDAGLAATNKTIDTLVEMGADCVPCGKILGAAGVAVVDSLFGSIFHGEPAPTTQDLDDHITRSTNEILSDMHTMSNQMAVYHDQEMTQLKALADKVDEANEKLDLLNFNAARVDAQTYHEEFLTAVSNNGSGISNEFENKTYNIIDEDTYEAFTNIVGSNSGITHGFNSMKTYLTEEHVYDIIARVAKSQYDRSITNMLTAKHEGQYDPVGISSLNELENYLSYDGVKSEIKGYQADMMLYYNDCVQIAQMQYDIRNYEAYQKYADNPAKLQDKLTISTNTYNNTVNSYTTTLKSIINAYDSAFATLEKAQAATVTVSMNGTDYRFTSDDALQAWIAVSQLCYFDLDTHADRVEFTLDKDWIATKTYGLASNADMKEFFENTLGANQSFFCYVGAPQCDFNSITRFPTETSDLIFNLNGHTFDVSATPKQVLMAGLETCGTIIINGDSDRQSTMAGGAFEFTDFHAAAYETKININDVTIDGGGTHKLFLMNGNYTVALNNCTVNTQQGNLTNLDYSRFLTNNTQINYL